jgi:cell division protein FtsA
VRVGVPEYRGNLHEVVKSPRYATVMGLLQEGRVQRMRGRKVVVQSGSARQIWTRMKEWFIGNF